MKKEFKEANLRLVRFTADVILTSGTGHGGTANESTEEQTEEIPGL